MKLAPSTVFVPATEAKPARPGGAALDVLRFVAAAFILLFHYGQNAPVALETFMPVFGQGWLATDFFLLLSGYILSRAYGERLVSSHMRPTQFFLRRFARLWPSHAVVLLAFATFVVASTVAGFAPMHADKYGIGDFFAQICLVHGWGMFASPSWNVPTWTLSALLVCYALFSVYVPLIHKRSIAVLAGLAAVVLIGAHLTAVLLAHHAFVDLPFEWGLLRAVPLFILGNLIERATRSLRLGRNAYALSLAACAFIIVMLVHLPRNAVTDTVILGGLATILAVSGGVIYGENIVTRRMGRASFSLFLTHSLIGALWFGLSPKLIAHFGLSPSAQWSLWSAGVVVAIVTAFVFDALVDRPLSDYVSRLSFVRGEGQ